MLKAILGLVAAIFILSLKTGMILGISQNKVKQIMFFSLIFGIGLELTIMIFYPMQDLMIDILDKYTFIGSTSIAVFLIYLGVNGETNCLKDCNEGRANKKYIAVLLPCPLCLIALALTVILLGPVFDISIPLLGCITSVVFFLMVITISLGTRTLLNKSTIDPEDILNTFLLVLGTFILCCGLFIPSLVQSMTTSFSPITLEAGSWTYVAILSMGSLLILGYIKNMIMERKGGKRKW